MSTTISLPWRGDFSIDDRGHTLLVDGDVCYLERMVRRLLTTPRLFDRYTGEPVAPPDYIFSPAFGAGLRRIVNSIPSAAEIQRIVTAQIVNDPETSRKTRPIVEVKADTKGTYLLNVTAIREPSQSIAFALKISG